MRGTKLEAWRIPAVWESLQENVLDAPDGSAVLRDQEKMLRATREVLASMAKDIREGLLETVGIESALSMAEGRCSVLLSLPEGSDTDKIARAIDLENIEAWRDTSGDVHIAVAPWFSTKDVDQTVLSAVKVIHVMLGIHATDTAGPKTITEKLLSSVIEVMQLQKSLKNRKD